MALIGRRREAVERSHGWLSRRLARLATFKWWQNRARGRLFFRTRRGESISKQGVQHSAISWNCNALRHRMPPPMLRVAALVIQIAFASIRGFIENGGVKRGCVSVEMKGLWWWPRRPKPIL